MAQRVLMIWAAACLLLSPFLQFLVNGRLKSLQAGIAQERSIHKDRRSPSHPSLCAVLIILVDDLHDLRVIHVLFKLLHVESQLLGLFLHDLIVQTVVVLKETVMELPELSLLAGRERGRGGFTGELMGVQWKVLEDQFDLALIFFEHLIEERAQSSHSMGTGSR